jgi:ABC-type amino acid transport system permease subunit
MPTAEPAAAGAETRVSLKALDSRLTVPERIALSDAGIRRQIATIVLWLFAGTNILSVIFVIVLYYFDQRDIADHLIPATARVITPSVVMSLLGATTVQLGAIAVIMARGIFNVPIDQPYPIVEES